MFCNVYVMFSKINAFVCIHLVAISFLLLMFFGSLVFLIISTFSLKHKSQNLFPGLYDLHFFIISHLMLGLGLSLFSHMYWASVVAFFFVWVFERLYVVIISSFKCCLSHTYVIYFVVNDCCFIYYTACVTFLWYRTYLTL